MWSVILDPQEALTESPGAEEGGLTHSFPLTSGGQKSKIKGLVGRSPLKESSHLLPLVRVPASMVWPSSFIFAIRTASSHLSLTSACDLMSLSWVSCLPLLRMPVITLAPPG